MISRIFLRLAMPLTLGALASQAGAAPEDALLARDAFKAGNASRLAQLASNTQGELLAAYPQYWLISLRLNQGDDSGVRGFLTQYADSPLANRMRLAWIKELGKRSQWDTIRQEFPLAVDISRSGDPELACYGTAAKLNGGDASATAEARSLWLQVRDANPGCETLFQSLGGRGVLSEADIWARVRIGMEEGRSAVFRSAARWLPAGEGFAAGQAESALENPGSFLARRAYDLGKRSGREVAIFAVHRLAKTNPTAAAGQLEALEPSLSAEERQYAWGQVGWQAAQKLQPEAAAWYARSKNIPLGEAQLEWKVRAGLRAGDWHLVLDAVNAMPEELQRTDAWAYWKARSLKATGRAEEARPMLLSLSKEHHFYGILAAEELGSSVQVPGERYKPSQAEVQAIEQLPGIQRAFALYRLNMRPEANREWIWATRNLNDQQLLAAAELARRSEWYDRAINTAEKTSQVHDFHMRFLAPFRDELKAAAQQQSLDDAWVYGLIRQESRFVNVARSHVGASGLMQLMPATAKWVAGRMGMTHFSMALVNDISTNAALGTYYLRYVLDSLGHPVLATAAYNAGPGRARAWRAGTPLEAAAYTESIPFNETRDYVKKVMANKVYYRATFGYPQRSLKKELGSVPGKGND